jgi:hypothetical protein
MRGSLFVERDSARLSQAASRRYGRHMPASQLIFFLIWLLAALAAGVAIYLVWQRLYAK